MTSIWAILAAVAAAGYLAVAAMMYVNQRKFQYFPDRSHITPAAAGLSGVEDVRLKTADGPTIAAWYAPARTRAVTILYFHGNAGAIHDRSERFAWYTSQGFGVMFVSYRGYGASQGSPTEPGLINDALAAWDYLVGERAVEPSRLALVGESLGTAVALQLAARRPVAAIALESPMTSAADVGAHAYPFLPVRTLMKDRFDSLAVIGKVDAPILVIHGDADTTVPIKLGRRLFAAATEPKEMIVRPGDGHDIYDQRTWRAEAAFFRRTIPQR